MKANNIPAEDIFEKNVGSLQGKRTRKKTSQVVTTTEDVTKRMLEKHGNVILEADIMYVNEVPFVVAISQGINFGTAEILRHEKTATISTFIKLVLQIYHTCGCKVQQIHRNCWESIKKT